MVNRVSDPGNYATILANLQVSQLRLLDANERVSSQKNGHDLKGFAVNDELLIATRTLKTRLTAFQSQNDVIADKLQTQDGALKQVADAALAARQAIAQALATGHAETLNASLQSQLDKAIGALNTKYNGNFLFAGGQIATQPVSTTTLAGLNGPLVSTFFHNDQFKAQAQLDDSTTVTTGVLASDVGTPLLTAFQNFAVFDAGPSGPINGGLTPAQRTFLEAQLQVFDAVHQGIIGIAAQNGTVQQRVDQVKSSLDSQVTTTTIFVSNITDADIAKASVDLQLAQNGFKAAAQVFQTLKDSSLLNLLSIQ